jgi:hypothetical protein
MNLTEFFRARGRPSKRGGRGRGQPHHQRRRLRLEVLEDRYLCSYSITDLGTLGTISYGEGINNSGQAAVSAASASDRSLATGEPRCWRWCVAPLRFRVTGLAGLATQGQGWSEPLSDGTDG